MTMSTTNAAQVLVVRMWFGSKDWIEKKFCVNVDSISTQNALKKPIHQLNVMMQRSGFKERAMKESLLDGLWWILSHAPVAKTPLKRIKGATIWLVELLGAATSSAGCAWLLGQLMDQKQEATSPVIFMKKWRIIQMN
jgi:hypothetical protein